MDFIIFYKLPEGKGIDYPLVLLVVVLLLLLFFCYAVGFFGGS